MEVSLKDGCNVLTHDLIVEENGHCEEDEDGEE